MGKEDIIYYRKVRLGNIKQESIFKDNENIYKRQGKKKLVIFERK